jgi:suppressor of ftsI
MALSRGLLVVPVFILAGLVVSAAAPTRVMPQNTAAAASAAVDCTPHTNGRIVEDPPTVGPDQHDVTLYVLSDGNHYCYKQHPGDRYREAPTIVVRQGGYFDLTLINQLPRDAGPRPTPYAMQDGCPVLPIEMPTPMPKSPNGLDFVTAPPTPFLTYLNHQRSIESPPPAGSTAPPMGMTMGDTNFHTHGLDVEPLVDNVFKSTAAAKDGTCKYHFQMLPYQAAGTYWYHAHLHGMAEEQVSGGLAGTIVVLPPKGVSPQVMGRVLLVKDFVKPGQTQEAATQAKRRVAPGTMFAAGASPAAAYTPVPNVDPFNPPAWHSSTWLNPDGRPDGLHTDCVGTGTAADGEPIQIDGVRVPKVWDPAGPVADVPVTAQNPNAPQLYRIVDGTADYYLNVRLFDTRDPQHPVPETLHVIARDGVPVAPPGAADVAVLRDNVLVPPAGRVDILVPGSRYSQTIVADHMCTGNNGSFEPRRPLMRIVPATTVALKSGALAGAVPALAAVARPGQTRADAFLAEARALPNRIYRAITFQQYWTSGNSGFYVSETSNDPLDPHHTPFVERPFWLGQPDRKGEYVMPTIRVHKHAIEHWTLINAASEVHAFHIHQLTFVTLNNPFEPGEGHVFQDTVALEPGTPVRHGSAQPTMVTPTKTEIEIDFRKVPRGTFVFHCHMLFHEDHGMMAIITVD